MGCSRKLEEAVAIIISCTRRIKRPTDLVALAENILYAKKCLGSLEAVGEAVGLSVQQLKDFLAVEKLCAEVKALVKERYIDSVDMVKTISSLPAEKQKVLAQHFAKGQITSQDVRIIATFAKRFPGKSISKVVKDYERTKDTRVYVAQFRLPKNFNGKAGLRKRFEEIVGKAGLKRLQLEGEVGSLEVTALGYKKLREAVRKRKTTLRSFIGSILSEVGEGK